MRAAAPSTRSTSALSMGFFDNAFKNEDLGKKPDAGGVAKKKARRRVESTSRRAARAGSRERRRRRRRRPAAPRAPLRENSPTTPEGTTRGARHPSPRRPSRSRSSASPCRRCPASGSRTSSARPARPSGAPSRVLAAHYQTPRHTPPQVQLRERPVRHVRAEGERAKNADLRHRGPRGRVPDHEALGPRRA